MSHSKKEDSEYWRFSSKWRWYRKEKGHKFNLLNNIVSSEVKNKKMSMNLSRNTYIEDIQLKIYKHKSILSQSKIKFNVWCAKEQYQILNKKRQILIYVPDAFKFQINNKRNI